jgi:hypothetical protein
VNVIITAFGEYIQNLELKGLEVFEYEVKYIIRLKYEQDIINMIDFNNFKYYYFMKTISLFDNLRLNNLRASRKFK